MENDCNEFLAFSMIRAIDSLGGDLGSDVVRVIYFLYNRLCGN